MADIQTAQAAKRTQFLSPDNRAGISVEDVSPGFREKLMLFGGSDHKTYLGCISCSEYESDSIFNQFGRFGSRFSSTSIFNSFSDYGSRYSKHSVCNPYAQDPPVIVDKNGKYYGRLTINLHAEPIESPEMKAFLDGLCGTD